MRKFLAGAIQNAVGSGIWVGLLVGGSAIYAFVTGVGGGQIRAWVAGVAVVVGVLVGYLLGRGRRTDTSSSALRITT